MRFSLFLPFRALLVEWHPPDAALSHSSGRARFAQNTERAAFPLAILECAPDAQLEVVFHIWTVDTPDGGIRYPPVQQLGPCPVQIALPMNVKELSLREVNLTA